MWRYIKKINSAKYIVILKIRYKKKISISLKQRIGSRIKILISNSNTSYLEIKSSLNNRRNVTIHADGGKIIIGENVFLNENCNIVAHKSIIIGNDSTFGPNVCVYDHDHNYLEGGFISDNIVIGNNVWIGANAIILRGTTIGDNCVVGAGSIVKGKYEANTKIVQNRELILKRICKNGE